MTKCEERLYERLRQEGLELLADRLADLRRERERLTKGWFESRAVTVKICIPCKLADPVYRGVLSRVPRGQSKGKA